MRTTSIFFPVSFLTLGAAMTWAGCANDSEVMLGQGAGAAEQSPAGGAAGASGSREVSAKAGAGGEAEAAGGQAGAGGEAEAAGGQAGAGGAAPNVCVPQDAVDSVSGSGPCTLAIVDLGVVWNGTACVKLRGNDGCHSCKGSDCETVATTTLEACRQQHAACQSTDVCAAQDAKATIDPGDQVCTQAIVEFGVKWNGSSCEALGGTNGCYYCQGSDCDALYDSQLACLLEHSLCVIAQSL